MTSLSSTPAGRYGGSGSSRTVWAIGSAAILTFFAWTAWVFSTDPTTGIEWVTFESTTGTTTGEMSFQITAPPGTAVTCALRTVDSSMGTNGWDVRSFPASPHPTAQYSATIRAVSEVTGIEVYRCWRSGS